MNTPMTPPQPPPRSPGLPPRPLPPHPRAFSAERAARAEATFNSALERPAAARAAFVAEACGEDGELQARVRELLAAHERAEGFMKGDALVSPEVEAELARLKPEEGGEGIGPYKLREQIGEGGFGTVWVADQEMPVRRRVALKIIKVGMDTKEVIARFEQERQALAMMDHPNIAKVLDAGATAHGRPFFVMELVRGLKITDYCDDKQFSTQERIELFITVCQAVQHAHQKGIIHRDLKPSNILVTINDGKAVPKVIDFGVAKATHGRLVEQTVYTQFHQMIGTPLYMSPEQAELTSLDIDTRSDIYSLGVLLYELLTGHTPIEQDTLARVGMDEIRRIIREVDPPRPSPGSLRARFSILKRNRQEPAKRLNGRLPTQSISF
jgi:eukaryotic-like serine/threonine-protein kinase